MWKVWGQAFKSVSAIHSSTNEETSKWDNGLLICISVFTIAYFFEFLDRDKGILLSALAAGFFGPILGIFAYLLGGFLFVILGSVFSESYDYASRKGLPAPLAFIWAIGCVIVMALAMEGGLRLIMKKSTAIITFIPMYSN